jgi:hypothetical protein
MLAVCAEGKIAVLRFRARVMLACRECRAPRTVVAARVGSICCARLVYPGREPEASGGGIIELRSDPSPIPGEKVGLKALGVSGNVCCCCTKTLSLSAVPGVKPFDDVLKRGVTVML